ncbi:patatin-like phospholipase family protein [Proteinivorax hydrogeniformans]|uniref:Patatin-like phospholipase family protein n=1 Tax=Proteinivorax hydrogeniformans TaxID=1826727 RepID=A0AAU8HTW8_9FIRM
MTVGLTLSGGGQKGIAHLGVIKGIEEDGLKFNCMSGTSAGAIISSLYATGKSFDQILRIVKSLERSDVLDLNINFWQVVTLKLALLFKVFDFEQTVYWGLFAGERLKSILEKNLPNVPIKDVDATPLAITAVDVHTGQDVIFTNRKEKLAHFGNVIDDIPLPLAVRSSMAIPFIYTGVKWKDYYFIDGGLTNNIPTKLIKFLGAQKSLAVDVSEKPPYKEKPTNIIDMGGRIISIAIDSSKYHTKPDILLKPNISSVSLGDFSSTEKLVELGYEEYKRNRKSLLGLFK